MNRFQGIRQEDMWLLAENRFQDSKAFYEDHKPQLRAGILQPLHALFSDMAPEMLKIDPQIVADPMRNGQRQPHSPGQPVYAGQSHVPGKHVDILPAR